FSRASSASSFFTSSDLSGSWASAGRLASTTAHTDPKRTVSMMPLIARTPHYSWCADRRYDSRRTTTELRCQPRPRGRFLRWRRRARGWRLQRQDTQLWPRSDGWKPVPELDDGLASVYLASRVPGGSGPTHLQGDHHSSLWGLEDSIHPTRQFDDGDPLST